MDSIVVGVDGSQHGEAALRWALEEAEHHDAGLTAVLAWTYLDQAHPGAEGVFDPEYGQEAAAAALREVVEAVAPSRPVTQRAVCDLPAQALLEAGAGADLLVVGARGLGGFKGLLLGSVSERVLESAPCPVAVVRGQGPWPPDGVVVVGIDGSEPARTALRWAAAEARARSAPLRVVHAWQVPYFAAPATGEVMVTIEAAARTVLDDALSDPALEGLQVEGHLPCQGAAQAILALADDASLVVAGTRGHGRLGRAILGSTSRQLAHHVACPLVVLPPERD